MELIHVEKSLLELVQKEWDEMDVIGITHSQQTQKDVSYLEVSSFLLETFCRFSNGILLCVRLNGVLFSSFSLFVP